MKGRAEMKHAANRMIILLVLSGITVHQIVLIHEFTQHGFDWARFLMLDAIFSAMILIILAASRLPRKAFAWVLVGTLCCGTFAGLPLYVYFDRKALFGRGRD
jgi:hypothetical protein